MMLALANQGSLAFGAISVICTGFALGLFRLRQRQLAYQRIMGRIVSKQFEHQQDCESSGFVSVIEVEYEVGGRRYRSNGDNVLKIKRLSGSGAAAERRTVTQKVGDEIEIFYDPRRPERAITDPAACGSALALCAFAILFATFAFVIGRP